MKKTFKKKQKTLASKQKGCRFAAAKTTSVVAAKSSSKSGLVLKLNSTRKKLKKTK